MAKVNFTAGRVAAFTCPPEKLQAFMWDSAAPGLALRVTTKGARSYVYQSRLTGKPVRLTIGDVKSWSIPDARAEARRLQGLMDRGADPRVAKAEQLERDARKRKADAIARAKRRVTGIDAWAAYCDARGAKWSERNLQDHLSLVTAGGQLRKRAPGKVTQAGALRGLLNRPLNEVDADRVENWVQVETKIRPSRTALAFRLLRAFINWCGEHPTYKEVVQSDACRRKRTRQALAKPTPRRDVLQREQLKPWFSAVMRLAPVPSAYLQALLLTGARREELLSLTWEDVDSRWSQMRIRDKVEGERTIPLTRHVAALLDRLKTLRNQEDQPLCDSAKSPGTPPPSWVFFSKTSKNGRFQEPRIPHNRALAAAEIPHLTLHGLRRSFGTLSEWCEMPVGIVAQIQGHKPSAIAERHYRARPVDLLRLWHQRYEDWLLMEAGILKSSDEMRNAPDGSVQA